MDSKKLLISLSKMTDSSHFVDKEETNIDTIFEMIEHIKRAKEVLAFMERQLERQCYLAMEENKVSLKDGRVLTKQLTASRKNWSSDDVLAELRKWSQAHGEDMSNILAKCARFEWRVRSLRDYGVEADEFSETIVGRRTVQLDWRKDYSKELGLSDEEPF